MCRGDHQDAGKAVPFNARISNVQGSAVVRGSWEEAVGTPKVYRMYHVFLWTRKQRDCIESG